jgi:dimethylhistidine N-methyltransferase
MDSRLSFVEVLPSAPKKICQAVRDGLDGEAKSLPTRFLYDAIGSEFFEKITQLPEYYLTRTEESILANHAGEMAEAAGSDTMLIEFGSGSSIKTRRIIDAILARQGSLDYAPIDISIDFLRTCSSALLNEYGKLQIKALGAEYFDAIEHLPEHDGPRLILFLGSNIGNFETEEAIDFLSRIRRKMNPEDRILLGIDLAKDRSIVEPAYNDAQGITAAFNLNLLRRINCELDGQFDLRGFIHFAPYDEATHRIEMKLISNCDQKVAVDGISRVYEFSKHEEIHTEWSHKYTFEGLSRLASHAGLQIDHTWTDPREWFAEVMLRP